MGERIDHGSEAMRIIDQTLLEEEEKLAELRRWADHDDQDLLQGWVHDIIEMKDVADYDDAA